MKTPFLHPSTLLLAAHTPPLRGPTGQRPNFVFIYTDDLGLMFHAKGGIRIP